MENLEVFLVALFVSVSLLNALASWLNVPYPIVLVVGGLALALVPGVPTVELEPDLVLTIFLPPLLYSAAFFSDLRALRQDVRAISVTAIGLVILTAVAVAVAAHQVIGMSWPMAFALGAIVSPTDPVAATALMRRVGAPRRIVNVIEGESLINDAAALVLYRTAVAAAVGGSFSLFDASLEFVGAAVGGIAIGLAVGFVITEIRRRLDDVPTEITISLLTGYAAFLPAEELGLSGVLAAVTAGIYLGWNAPHIASPQMRLQGAAVWEILVFLLNATLFILIGLQLPEAVDGLEQLSAAELAGYAALVTIVILATRFAWVFTVPYLIRLLDRRPAQRARRVGRRLGPSAHHRRGRGTPGARADPVHRLLRDPDLGRRPGADTARPDPPPRRRRGRERAREGGGRGAPRCDRRGDPAPRGARARGLGQRGHG
jgi:monovalent cation/hydrogen antiporter